MHAQRTFIISSIVAILCGPCDIRAEQLGTMSITPRFSPGQPLTVELRNLSKLPVQITSLTVRFSGADPASPCTLTLPGAALVAPAATTSVRLADSDDVLKCMPDAGPRLMSQPSASLSGSAERPGTGAAADGQPQRLPVELSVSIMTSEGEITNTSSTELSK